jgi:hypothetical protein
MNLALVGETVGGWASVIRSFERDIFDKAIHLCEGKAFVLIARD